MIAMAVHLMAWAGVSLRAEHLDVGPDFNVYGASFSEIAGAIFVP